ncbi:conserved Plasmodium protein, unknown function [Plasmodium ovale]|uniref:Uncharacterized protein n=2 Tax=Plasmodium ovale TaxID=36330 RepID=A0A1A8W537_PLAOA|nr:conserved Plasmodium protein, unknown function [Plasmodium ovale curtisi]SBS96639.1 conserved Plasmodium protein, unknown function [Plasmodium ovale curtisi]SCP05552.1 conserved Plasmodium protein, unknown function [Plasmodium ovale]
MTEELPSFGYPSNSYEFEMYKKLIVKITFILSTITFCFSILSIILVKLFAQDQNGTYDDLNMAIEEDNKPKTYLYVRKDSCASPHPAKQNCSNKHDDQTFEGIKTNDIEEQNDAEENSQNEGELEKRDDESKKKRVMHETPRRNVPEDDTNDFEKKNSIIRIVMN